MGFDRTTDRYTERDRRRGLDEDWARVERTREQLRREQEEALRAEKERIEKGR